MENDNFVSEVIGNGRVTIPKKTREKLNLKDGDYVQVAIKKVECT